MSPRLCCEVPQLLMTISSREQKIYVKYTASYRAKRVFKQIKKDMNSATSASSTQRYSNYILCIRNTLTAKQIHPVTHTSEP